MLSTLLNPKRQVGCGKSRLYRYCDVSGCSSTWLSKAKSNYDQLKTCRLLVLASTLPTIQNAHMVTSAVQPGRGTKPMSRRLATVTQGRYTSLSTWKPPQHT